MAHTHAFPRCITVFFLSALLSTLLWTLQAGPFGGGRSILSIDLGYTDECGMGHLAICLSEPTSFIMAHGHGDNWPMKHMMMYAVTVHISPLKKLDKTLTEEELAGGILDAVSPYGTSKNKIQM